MGRGFRLFHMKGKTMEKLNKKQKDTLKNLQKKFGKRNVSWDDDLPEFVWVFGHPFKIEEDGELTDL